MLMADLFVLLEVARRAPSAEEQMFVVDVLIPVYLTLCQDQPLAEAMYPAPDCASVGRPARPVCVPPESLPFRKAVDKDGRAALLHAIAHIEFNAINLALDAAWRFQALGPALCGTGSGSLLKRRITIV